MTHDKDASEERRLLPGDYQRKIKYESLDDTPKDIEQVRGRFFEFPEDLKGAQFHDRDFLVFYFDTPEEYELALKYFGAPSKAAVSHPEVNTKKLIRLIEGESENADKKRKRRSK